MSEHQPHTLAGGRYLLVAPIGEGGMATVFRSFDQRLQVWRAVKVLNPKYAKSQRVKERFDAEAQTMALLEHPHIVRVYDVGSIGDVSYIVMELVQGGSLVDWLERYGPMPAKLALSAIDQVCKGISAAHSKGVIHRDIKPHNVLVTLDGVCRVTDFGIARVGNTEMSKTKTGAVMKTWGYMAPEQRTDAKGVDERADVYALAATLFTLVTNRIPMDLFAADRDATMLEGVPEDLFGVLTKATEYHRDARYSSVEEFRNAIVAVANHLPPDPPSTPPLVSLKPIRLTPPDPELVASAKPLVETDTPGSVNPTLAPATSQSSSPDSMGGVPIDAGTEEEMRRGAPPWMIPAAIAAIGGLLLLVAATVVLAGGAAWRASTQSQMAQVEAQDSENMSVKEALGDGSSEDRRTDDPPVTSDPAPTNAGTTPSPQSAASSSSPASTPAPAPTPAPASSPAPSPAPSPASTPSAARLASPPAPAAAAAEECIETNVPSVVTMGGKAAFRAKLCSAATDAQVTLHYRPAGAAGSWQAMIMAFRVGQYVHVLDVDERFAAGLEYYIETKGAREGTRDKPMRINVR